MKSEFLFFFCLSLKLHTYNANNEKSSRNGSKKINIALKIVNRINKLIVFISKI